MEADSVVELMKYYELTPAATREEVGQSRSTAHVVGSLIQTSSVVPAAEFEQIHAILQYWVSGCSNGSYDGPSRLSHVTSQKLLFATILVNELGSHRGLPIVCVFTVHVCTRTCFISRLYCLGACISCGAVTAGAYLGSERFWTSRSFLVCSFFVNSAHSRANVAYR